MMGQRRKSISWKVIVVILALVLAIFGVAIWKAVDTHTLQGPLWSNLSKILLGVGTIFAVIFGALDNINKVVPLLKTLFGSKSQSSSPSSSFPSSSSVAPPAYTYVMPMPSSALPASLPQQRLDTQIPALHEPPSDSFYRNILSRPLPTAPAGIAQRTSTVQAIYSQLMQTDTSATVLTGISGSGKSTLAALVYRYAEERRKSRNGYLHAQPLWLNVEPSITITDIAGTIIEALGEDFVLNTPQRLVVRLFDILRTTRKRCLIVVDQFEELLDWETGKALPGFPGVGELIDAINSDTCPCRFLLTSRSYPIGTRLDPQLYLQEYSADQLEIAEGASLLKKRGVKGTGEEMETAVKSCDGHALALTLLSLLLKRHQMQLSVLLDDPTLWEGDIAANFLDRIYDERLGTVQHRLLKAFSIYRRPVPLEAARAIIGNITKNQVMGAHNGLLIQRLLLPVVAPVMVLDPGSHYSLHAIIANYARDRFSRDNI